MTSFSGVKFVLFCFVFVFILSLKPRPFVQSSFDILLLLFVVVVCCCCLLLLFLTIICRRPNSHTCFFIFCFTVYSEMSFFPSIFCTIAAFSLCEEYVVRPFLPNGVFLPCDHGLDF